jgi:hypothetical protein
MKAIFAVTALAAAISGQALAADTETTTSFTGVMNAQFIYDMQPDLATYDIDQNVDGDDNEGYEITMSTAVVNGPFSGSVGITNREGVTAFDIGDLVVTDGSISFGQVGSLMATDEYTGGAANDMKDGNDLSVDVGFRYAVSDSLKVQLQGLQSKAAVAAVALNAATATPASAGVAGVGESVGVAAVYTGTAGALSYVANAEMYASALGADLGVDAPYFAGAAATYTSDMVTVKAVVNMSRAAGSAAALKSDAQTEYVVSATTTLAGATLTATYQEESSADDDESFKGVVSYAAGVITPSAGYTMTTLADAGDEVYGKLAYSAGSISASGTVTMGNFDAATADEALIELSVSTTSDAGVTYAADYATQADVSNKVTLGASYAF